MQNQPMSSGDQIKLLIFTLLLAPSVMFFVGIIPAVFLIFGLYMMKRNQDFSSIDAAVKAYNGYMWLAIISLNIYAFINGDVYSNRNLYPSLHSDATVCDANVYLALFECDYNSWRYNDDFSVPMVFVGITISYLILVNFLFYKPLYRHRDWVVANGIFSNRAKSGKDSKIQSDVDIIKGEKLKQYSVADELTKWAKLKEDGHISEEEFNEARTKLLKRN
ncbi:hypothetical protein NL53_10875 [Vibrio variabilis]|uniref:SHOCT domain-containing protein n=1 Tax=Vibrio variabilis TaxID=990271 RepID=A0ABR4YB76_9VIBR|nr:SHOCT domain-containing protein [Vibrio variabilis]KHA60560.1 hypothetical protein NL53_10875 [Vibrio variabilis]